MPGIHDPIARTRELIAALPAMPDHPEAAEFVQRWIAMWEYRDALDEKARVLDARLREWCEQMIPLLELALEACGRSEGA
jgi:hypothetical protein